MRSTRPKPSSPRRAGCGRSDEGARPHAVSIINRSDTSAFAFFLTRDSAVGAVIVTKGHVRDIFEKLSASDRAHAAVIAFRRGFCKMIYFAHQNATHRAQGKYTIQA